MKQAKKRILRAERNRILVEAINRARNAMLLLQGMQLAFENHEVYLDFQQEITKLTVAMKILGLDASLPARVKGASSRLEV
jgi:hypothetical protein